MTRLCTSAMNHTRLYSSAAQLYRSLAVIHFSSSPAEFRMLITELNGMPANWSLIPVLTWLGIELLC